MKFSKEELSAMEFNDPFDIEEPGEYEEDDCCSVCGSVMDSVTIGYNEKKQLFKFDCANCGTSYVIFEGSGEKVLLKGEERNWPEYLLEAFKFPFEATIIESNDREFFDPDYDGPWYLDQVKVLDVYYSMKYGVEALIRMGRKTYPQILCFLEAADADSRNYVELENYKRWRDKYWTSDYLKDIVEVVGIGKQEQAE